MADFEQIFARLAEQTEGLPEHERIENNFRYHAPKDGQQVKYEDLRGIGKQLAYLINGLCPDSREKALAMTKLEESVMWANASIARNE
jgi:hypothetical protein